MRVAIVTGASGFIGQAVVKELLRNNYRVYAVIRKHFESEVFSYEHCIPVVCDLDNLSNLSKELGSVPGALFFHFAWSGTSGLDRADTVLQLKNVQWTIDALRIAKSLKCSRFIGAGSIMEDETTAAVRTQGSKPGLGYVYGSGKLVAHAMAKSIATSIDLDFIWTYITNAYGVGEFSPRLINSTIRKCIKGEVPEFTSGKQNYDFVYIDDVARAFRLIGERGKPFCEYLIGSGEARPLKEFLQQMNESIAPHLKFLFGNVPFTGVNLPLSTFDTSLTERDTGFKAKVTFEEGCKRTFSWWKDQLEQVG